MLPTFRVGRIREGITAQTVPCNREAKALSVHTESGSNSPSGAAVNGLRRRGIANAAAEHQASQARGLLIMPTSPMGLQGLDP